MVSNASQLKCTEHTCIVSSRSQVQVLLNCVPFWLSWSYYCLEQRKKGKLTLLGVISAASRPSLYCLALEIVCVVSRSQPSVLSSFSTLLFCLADSLRGELESAFSGQDKWSGAPLLSKASMNLKNTKVAVMTDDEVDDYDWTCQGCLVRPLFA